MNFQRFGNKIIADCCFEAVEDAVFRHAPNIVTWLARLSAAGRVGKPGAAKIERFSDLKAQAGRRLALSHHPEEFF